MTVHRLPPRPAILRVLRRWDEARDGLPSTWDVLRAAGVEARFAGDLDRLAADGVLEVAGRARDGARLWRMSPAERSVSDAST